MKLGMFIGHIKGSHVRISKLRYISVLEYCFYFLSNSADPGVMLHSVACPSLV